eukprot:m.526353 g.526353  ORF g.526353 m.526353 type:complete len:83 (-) comp57547_c3_seq41:128-376(-)
MASNLSRARVALFKEAKKAFRDMARGTFTAHKTYSTSLEVREELTVHQLPPGAKHISVESLRQYAKALFPLVAKHVLASLSD